MREIAFDILYDEGFERQAFLLPKCSTWAAIVEVLTTVPFELHEEDHPMRPPMTAVRRALRGVEEARADPRWPSAVDACSKLARIVSVAVAEFCYSQRRQRSDRVFGAALKALDAGIAIREPDPLPLELVRERLDRAREPIPA